MSKKSDANKKKEDAIFRIEPYSDGTREVQVRHFLDSSRKKEFVGRGRTVVVLNARQQIPLHYDFTLKVKSVKEAFEKYDETSKKYAKKTVDQFVKEQKEKANKIHVPNGGVNPEALRSENLIK